jgi:hypothetical protein
LDRTPRPQSAIAIDFQKRRSGASDHRWERHLATAIGTLRDRIFCAEDHDVKPPRGFETFNRRYGELLVEAIALARDLQLPAVRDYVG